MTAKINGVTVHFSLKEYMHYYVPLKEIARRINEVIRTIGRPIETNRIGLNVFIDYENDPELRYEIQEIGKTIHRIMKGK